MCPLSGHPPLIKGVPSDTSVSGGSDATGGIILVSGKRRRMPSALLKRFPLCGRSPSAGAPVSPVLAAPLFASGCARFHAKHPGFFFWLAPSGVTTRIPGGSSTRTSGGTGRSANNDASQKRPRVAPLGRCPPLREIETPF